MSDPQKDHRVITLKVNGIEHHVAVGDGETLLDVLRDKLRLTGTKKGCNHGVCGACTVLVDREPKNSCLLLAASCDNLPITTIEGIAQQGQLHPLQRAFINHGAVQCGFCTPGILMSARAFLNQNPNPSENHVRQAISGNICRCTGYTKIVEAILDVAREG